MKIKFTLEEKESKSLRGALEDISEDLCRFVDCPNVEGDACENCPMAAINQKWENMREHIRREILSMIKEIER